MMEFGIIKAHIEKMKIIPLDRLRLLVQARSLSELLNILRSIVEYGPLLMQIRTPTIRNLYEAVTKKFRRRIENLIASSGDFGEFVKKYMKRFEVENIINILTKINSGYSKEEILKEIVCVYEPTINYENLADSNKVMDAINKLDGTEYEISRDVKESIASGRSILLVQEELMSKFFTTIIKVAEKINGIDGKIVSDSIRLEAEVENIFIAWLSTMHGGDINIFRKLIIPVSYKIGYKKIIEYMYTKDRDILLKHLIYIRIFNRLIEEEETLARIEAFRLQLDLLRKREKEVFISEGFFWLLFKLYEYEWRNLRAIIYGVALNMDKNRLVRHLIF
ncbi:MAG: V0D/AC39 family V-type ATPase subunit [Candidatus Njordarchaeales archaeon]